ncbi:MAG: acyl carrier protein [Fretibacterium sp.]
MQTVFKIVSEILGQEVTADTSMENTEGWDSLKTLQIVMALDEAGVSIPLEKIAEIRSVADIVRFSGQDHA